MRQVPVRWPCLCFPKGAFDDAHSFVYSRSTLFERDCPKSYNIILQYNNPFVSLNFAQIMFHFNCVFDQRKKRRMRRMKGKRSNEKQSRFYRNSTHKNQDLRLLKILRFGKFLLKLSKNQFTECLIFFDAIQIQQLSVMCMCSLVQKGFAFSFIGINFKKKVQIYFKKV